MSSETRERISQVISELDYRPNALARSLKQKRTHTIGAIVANILNPFTTSIIRGIEDVCQKAGYSLILCNADDNPGKEKDYIDMLAAKQIDGLIINTTGQNNVIVQAINQKLPVVLIDRKAPEINIDTVTVDSTTGARIAVEHLITLGHRDIAMLTLPFDGITPRLERVKGYKQALADNNILFRPEFLVTTDSDFKSVEEVLRELLSATIRPTAVFGVNNLITMAVVKSFKKLGVHIPKDIAVIGFDDWEWADLIDPPITVVRQPTYDMGCKAATILIKRMKSTKQNKTPSLVIFQSELVVRKSCGEKC